MKLSRLKNKELDTLKVKIEKLEREKVEHEKNTSKVIEQLTLLNFQKDDQLQILTNDMTVMNQTMSSDNDDLLSSGKKKKEKASKSEK